MKIIHALVAGAIATVSTLAPVWATATITSKARLDGEMLLAQVRNFCRPGESMFVSAETQDYWVNICGGDAPYTYVGVNKRNGNAIRVPLRDYDRDSFEAVNGNVIYILTRNTPRGSFLTVTQGSREILRQPITRWD